MSEPHGKRKADYVLQSTGEGFSTHRSRQEAILEFPQVFACALCELNEPVAAKNVDEV